MFDVVLFQPEIPGNTGNIIRLCANTGARLHLIKPIGFELEDKKLRRAGLDYREWADVAQHDSMGNYLDARQPARLFAFSTKARHRYSDVRFGEGDALLFGPESRGLPLELLQAVPPEQLLRLPMLEHSRSLNLSNSVAVAVFEAWRQLGFPGGR